MSIDPRLGLALMALCLIAFALVERDRQRRIAGMRSGENESFGSPEDDASSTKD